MMKRRFQPMTVAMERAKVQRSKVREVATRMRIARLKRLTDKEKTNDGN
jgi:hypothetical protein